MITYTASDIIRQAKIIGNVSNVNSTNFELSMSLLNQEYQKLYDKIVMSNGASIKEEHFTTDEPFYIPDDCYHILGVYSGKKLLSKSSPKQYIKGNYRIENNKILFDGFGPVDAFIKYSTDLTSLAPQFRLTPGATIYPDNGSEQDFSNGPIEYTVTSEDKQYRRTYRINFMSSKDIMEYNFDNFFLKNVYEIT